MAALVFVGIQALMGAYIAWSRVSVPSMLLHGGFVAGLFAALCYLSLQVIGRPRGVRRPLVRTSQASATQANPPDVTGAATTGANV
ncbi:MAG: hypothetical protein ACRDHP_06175 [Ktedonobacterales bacterium]